MHTGRPFWFGQLPPFAIVLPIAFVQVVFTIGAAVGQQRLHDVNALTFVLVLVAAGLLMWRRRYPILVLVAVYAVLTTYFALRNPFGPVFISLVVALFNTVANGRRPVAWTVGYVGGVGLYAAMMMTHIPLNWATAGAVLAWVSLVMGVGELSKARRDRVAQAAATQAEQDKRQASEERLRIAREVHDVLAHTLSGLLVQLEGARLVAEQ